jgi:hypothetical protein
VTIAAERAEGNGHHRCLLNRRVVVLLEVTLKPARRDPRMPARVLPRDQDRELEGLLEADAR